MKLLSLPFGPLRNVIHQFLVANARYCKKSMLHNLPDSNVIFSVLSAWVTILILEWFVQFSLFSICGPLRSDFMGCASSGQPFESLEATWRIYVGIVDASYMLMLFSSLGVVFLLNNIQKNQLEKKKLDNIQE